jgi:(R,R)-butanediol dehydrogenase/meso-butanediol dehydrogenase/diacetyl reductase
MKAAVFKEKCHPLVLEERQRPMPGKHQILIRVRAVGICGSDLHAAWADWTPTNIVMGHEFAGEVAAIGEGVSNWKIGDRVVPMATISCGECAACVAENFDDCAAMQTLDYNPAYGGAYAEYTVAGAHNTLPLPDSLAFEDAAAVEPLAVGYDAVRRAKLDMKDAVLIIGAGPIGLSIAQWCRHFGMSDVIVSETNSTRLGLANEMGATETIDASVEKNVIKVFERLTGRRPTIIFEAVGVPGMIQQCIDMAEVASRIIVVGVCMETDEFEPMQCIMKRLSLIFTLGYSIDDYATIIKLLEQGRIQAKPLISHRIGLDQLPDMFERMHRPGDYINSDRQPVALSGRQGASRERYAGAASFAV